MNKLETQKLTSIIKGYYNSQFFVDEYVISAWYDCLKPYEFDDAKEHIKEYLKEYPDTPPRPHVFIKNLHTKEEKERIRNAKFSVECNLCHKWMSLEDYDNHYGYCLSKLRG